MCLNCLNVPRAVLLLVVPCQLVPSYMVFPVIINIKKYQVSGELPAAGQVVPEAEEMKRLRKQIKQLELENEILKKAAAYFAKDSL